MPLAAEIAPPRRRQEELLTPSPVADFMASLFGPLPSTVRLLDAGAGALTAAFVSRCCAQQDRVRAIEATLYETAAYTRRDGCQRATSPQRPHHEHDHR